MGKLTGGIAHDYNNLLGIILGYTDLLEDELADAPKLKAFVQDIRHAADRGTKLTKKLLAFTRHKSSDTSIADINKLLCEQQLMLEKTLTSRIALNLDLHDHLWPVNLDSGDLEDAVINMCINAMHAIEGNGQLTLRTNNEHLNKLDAKELQLEPGDYVLLSITDTGTGMDAKTKERIFDPFFSTKGERGTGLGLSQVYGFIERCKGTIKTYSELGHGSCFALYFPRSYEKEQKDIDNIDLDNQDLSGDESILVVDDEPVLAELAKNILSNKGYDVCTAQDGIEALTVLQNNKVDLVISDVIMPNMDGYQLAEKIQHDYPKIKIQMVSGFADGRNNANNTTLKLNLLHKPYTTKTLLKNVRNLLDKKEKEVSPGNTNFKDELTGKIVLVMDDDTDAQELITINLNKLGCQALVANNADEAISLYKKHTEAGEVISIAILDLNIPGGHGGEYVAIQLRTLDPNVTLIVSSGDSGGMIMMHLFDFRENWFLVPALYLK